MSTFFQICSMVILCALALTLLVVVCTSQYVRLRDRLEEAAMDRAMHELAVFLRTSSNWFAEDEPTAELLRDCANSYEAGCRFISESEVRERWRMLRSAGKEST